ncbi:hypothetical protein BRADI_1g27490v3 [Brachypodium distachyon]|uniref:Small ribosomal subunit protein uS10 domain-containing protein n=1 Tax=Brachypodium distachyon TaxID=15368 RepID=I1GUE9_BRADI|nr:hypothetical protein BRADI_1g27490v3 [Brachypodium distachyon]
MAMAALRHAARRIVRPPPPAIHRAAVAEERRRLLPRHIHGGSSPDVRIFSLAEEQRRLLPRLFQGGSTAVGRIYSRQFCSFQLDKRTEETKEALYPRKMHSNDSAAKIRVVMKSFNNQKNNLVGLAPYTQKIGLPESQSLYTVLRSPHIDKKSREQFSMHVKKVFVVKKAETHELAKKFFWLKRMRIMGAQYEIHISFKTRLDKKIGCSKGVGLL